MTKRNGRRWIKSYFKRIKVKIRYKGIDNKLKTVVAIKTIKVKGYWRNI
jgi:hypothetical protein